MVYKITPKELQGRKDEYLIVDVVDKIIKLVQSSTRNILSHYRERAQLLRECSDDVKSLIRDGHDAKIAQKTAGQLFGAKDGISFLAVDGTQSQDEQLEMLIFYAGVFGYIGKLDFVDNKGISISVYNYSFIIVIIYIILAIWHR
jgi:hypothetical protein